MNETTSDILNRAADLIEERGWTDGLVGMSADPSKPICMEGALSAVLDLGVIAKGSVIEEPALKYPGWSCPAYRAVAEYLAMEEWQRLFDYNDTVGRTQAEVIEVLRACAVIEASRERETAEASHA